MAGQNYLDNLKYSEAKDLIQLPIIDENHQVLEEAERNVADSVIICERPEIELNPMRTEVFLIMPEFLNEPKDDVLRLLKKNIELTKAKFEELCKKSNKFIEEMTKTLKNLNNPSQELKKEISNIIEKFENTIKGLCAPLISQKEGLDSIDLTKLTEDQKNELEEDKKFVVNEINKFKGECQKLNENYYKIFSSLLDSITIVCNSIKEIPLPIQNIQNELEDKMTKFEEFLDKINDENKGNIFNNQLKKITKYFEELSKKNVIISNKVQNKCKILDNQYKKRSTTFLQLKQKVSNNIVELSKKSDEIKNQIIKIREKYKQKEIEFPQISISEIITDKIYNLIDNAIEEQKSELIILDENRPKMEISPIILDLLYLMDITGSMEEYVEETKAGLIDIL